MASGNGFEVAKAFVTIVPTMEGSQATITKELTGVTEPAAESAGESSGKKFGESLANGLKTTGAVIAGAMAAATGAAVALGKGFIDAANDVATLGDTIDKESQKMHVSSTFYQEFSFIAEHAGASVDGLKNAMKTLTAQAESGNEAFQALGISEEQVATLSQEDLFKEVISGLQGVTDESERTILAQELLGRSSVEFSGILNMSSEQMEEMRQSVHDLGGVMSEDAVKDAAAYKDAMLDMNTALDGVKKSMMSNFLPGISSVMNGLAKVFSGDKSGIGQIKEGLNDVISNITELAPEFLGLAQTLILSVIEGFAPMLPQLTESIFGVIVQAIVTITGMIPQLMPSIIAGIQGILTALFDALPVIVSGLLELVMGIVNWLSSGDNVTNFVNGIVQLVTMICEQISLILPVLLPAIVHIISEVVKALTTPDNVMMLVGAVLQIVGAIVVALINAVPEIIDLVVGVIGNLSDLLAIFFDWASDIVANVISAIVDTVKGWGENIKNFLSNLINNIKTGFSNWLTNLKTNFTNAFNFIRDKVSNIVEKVKELVSNVINKIKELPQKVVSIGSDLVRGLWEGISNMVSWIGEKLKSFGESVLGGLKDFFGIASPSKLFEDVIGKNLALGIAEGFDDEMANVESDMVDSMEGLTGNMTATVSAYGAQADTLSGGTTYNGGNVSINVYGAQGQNVGELADEIANRFEHMTRRKGAVYA